jgi:hypothetical protein
MFILTNSSSVTPAKAGVQLWVSLIVETKLDSRLRGNDELWGYS